MQKSIKNINKTYSEVSRILEEARAKSIHVVNFLMVQAYWNIGKIIVEEEQKGKKRAEYGEYLIQELSKRLTTDFGKGFTENNLRYMRQFYLVFQIHHAVSGETDNLPIRHAMRDKSKSISNNLKPENFLRNELSWTHYRFLLKIEKPEARHFYMNEAANNNWSTRELERQISSLLFERLSRSKNKDAVISMAHKGQEIKTPDDLVKDPYILEFLGLEKREHYFESDLEEALIMHLQHFLLELGKGFSFVARQKRITLDGDHYYIDLVFYNRLAKCFVLIDLKVGKLTHQDIGQMQMYVNYYQRNEKLKDESDPIGIILCAEKNDAVVKYTLPENQKQIYVSKYLPYLPSEDELKKEILKEREIIETEKRLYKN